MNKGKTTPLLLNCPEHKAFNATNGQVYRNYAELLDGLKRMDDPAFDHHTNKDGNHFTNWVRHVWSDDKLARDFEQNPTRMRMAQSVARRLKSLALRH
jgi:hypothetical protein